MSFSQRYGYKPARDTIQKESMDNALRTALWNCFYSRCLLSGRNAHYLAESSLINALAHELWADLFSRSLDELKFMRMHEFEDILKRIFFSFDWNEVYDFVEFVFEHYQLRDFKKAYSDCCNKVLEREVSAYRFINGQIAPIVDESEIQAIDEAQGSRHSPVRSHLMRSLELLTDRTNPDYRNSVKESISAVESLAEQLTGKHPAGIDDLMDYLTDNMNLHGALKSAFRKFYGWTSDDSGIRHALNGNGETTTFEDAKFMLVTCSAFVNYVEGKLA